LYNIQKDVIIICKNLFETNSTTRLYCYNCSGESTRNDYKMWKHQKTIL